jgi:hypothetical protein
MSRWRADDGQAAVELVSLLPLAALLLAVVWQATIAGHAVWAAGAAARAGARAAATGADVQAAARSRLPEELERDLAVRDDGTGTVEVAVPVPTLPVLPELGRITATAHFAPQR